MQVIVADAAVRFGDRLVFEHVDARFAAGRTTALVGPSGSGKSTLLAAIAGYQRLQAGSVTYLDVAGSSAPDPTRVAWVPQGSNALGARTAIDNVMIAPLSEGNTLAYSRELAEGALRKVGMLHLAHQSVRRLSGGEVQRVSFARALASAKPVILADEPSASLDSANTLHLAELLAELESRATIIIATHDPILMDAADDVVPLRTGTLHAA